MGGGERRGGGSRERKKRVRSRRSRERRVAIARPRGRPRPRCSGESPSSTGVQRVATPSRHDATDSIGADGQDEKNFEKRSPKDRAPKEEGRPFVLVYFDRRRPTGGRQQAYLPLTASPPPLRLGICSCFLCKSAGVTTKAASRNREQPEKSV